MVSKVRGLMKLQLLMAKSRYLTSVQSESVRSLQRLTLGYFSVVR